MAELAVGAAQVLVTFLVPFLEKLNSNNDLVVEIQSMGRRLGSMKAFIEDNDRRGDSRILEEKVRQVRDIAYDIEDVLEVFVCHSLHVFHHHRIIQKAHEFGHNIKHWFPLNDIRDKIAAIKRKIGDIELQIGAFPNGTTSSESGSTSSTDFHRVSPLLSDEEMVGYEDEKTRFTNQLIGGERGLVVLSVHGQAGSGKTTFVKNVFWKPENRRNFDCHAWVHVSRNCNVREILGHLLNQLSSPVRVSDSRFTHLDDISQTLHNYLMGKRYVVVLDDIWSVTDWTSIKSALPHGYRGSRIIVTTRDSNLAYVCVRSSESRLSINSEYYLNRVCAPDAWRLFCKKAFENGECPSELKDCASKIVARCEGLPFAIVAVGAALSRVPKFPNHWERFHHSLGSEIGQDSHLSVISNTLLPGYMDLSTNLKSCFLYFSVFPEDYSVERGRLIRLWVAEKFAVGTDGKTAEEVAEDYLSELIHRNLVHVSKWDFDGQPRSCRVLNLVLQFIVHKCKHENFASIFREETTSPKIRRLALHNDCSRLSQLPELPGLRSMLLLRSHNLSPDDFDSKTRAMELLRVLDLQGAPLATLPLQFSHLTILRYLCLRDTNIKAIPQSIEKLLFLETLDLKQTDVTKLPKQITKLSKLRHLFAYKYSVTPYVEFESVRGVEIHDRIGHLEDLQNLCHVKVDQKGKIIGDVKKLMKLRKLGLVGLRKEHCTDLCESISYLKKLKTLDLSSISKEEYLHLDSETMIGSPPISLERLYLKGRMAKLPRWINFLLANLTRIGLKWSKMNESPLNALGLLPNLMELQLVDCFVGGELVFEASSFKKLNFLLIEDFTQLHTLKIEDKSMPELRHVYLHKCPNLKLPLFGIHNCHKIEELVLRDMAKEFIELFNKNSEDRWMVRHIPFVRSYTLTDRSWSFENLSDTS